jgi:hypothetical protein
MIAAGSASVFFSRTMSPVALTMQMLTVSSEVDPDRETAGAVF